MPSLGADMDEGTLLEWLVHPGDPVHRGDVVAVVDTSKAAIEVECFEEGVVDDLLVQPGTRVPVGTPLARISTDGAVPGAVPAPQVTVPVPPTVAAPPSHGEHVTASPLVRRLAAEAGVDVETVHGTGRGGRVTRADVQGAAAAAARASGPAPKPRRPVTTPPEPAEAAELRRVTPYARRLAAELGVDLATVVTRGGPTSRCVRPTSGRRPAALRLPPQRHARRPCLHWLPRRPRRRRRRRHRVPGLPPASATPSPG